MHRLPLLRMLSCLFVGTLVVGLGGCSKTNKDEQIQVKASNDPLDAPRAVLQRYADGQPMSSEVSNFPQMIEEVRKVDKQRAAVLEKGLEELKKATPKELPTKAKELLKKIQPSMKG